MALAAIAAVVLGCSAAFSATHQDTHGADHRVFERLRGLTVAQFESEVQRLSR